MPKSHFRPSYRAPTLARARTSDAESQRPCGRASGVRTAETHGLCAGAHTIVWAYGVQYTACLGCTLVLIQSTNHMYYYLAADTFQAKPSASSFAARVTAFDGRPLMADSPRGGPGPGSGPCTSPRPAPPRCKGPPAPAAARRLRGSGRINILQLRRSRAF